MASYAKRSLVTVIAGAAVLTGLASPAGAAVNQFQDGLVNVAVGVEDVNVAVPVAVAANVAAQLCGINVGPLALGVLGNAIAVDRSGRTRTVCETDQGPVTIEQNTTQN